MVWKIPEKLKERVSYALSTPTLPAYQEGVNLDERRNGYPINWHGGGSAECRRAPLSAASSGRTRHGLWNRRRNRAGPHYGRRGLIAPHAGALHSRSARGH